MRNAKMVSGNGGEQSMSDFAEFGSRERDGWTDSEIVDAYVRHFVPITDSIGTHIAGKYISAGDSVLDLCCGQGTLTAALSNAAGSVTGLDFSPDMTAKAVVAAPDAKIVQGDAMDMPFDDDQFDKVICNFGMMHIPDQPKTLSEVRRVLKPNGTFTMATWEGPPTSPAFAAVFGALKAHADFSLATPQPDLFAFAIPDQARSMMASADLEVVEHGTVMAEWVLEKPTELFEIFLTATVGAGMLIRSQTDEVIEQIANAITKYVSENCFDGSGYNVPVAVAVITAKAI
jgi:ubiquinone/menaquinone biosynthesis C-methylase UbiE